MADHDRLGRKLADDPGVLAAHVVDAVPRHTLGLLPGFLDRGRITRPARRNRRVAGLAETVDPGTPGVRMQPETVDEDDRGSFCGHEPSSPLPACARKHAVIWQAQAPWPRHRISSSSNGCAKSSRISRSPKP